MIGTLICGFWGLFFQAPGVIKLVFAFSIYLCVLTFPFQNIKHNDFGRTSNFLLLILLFLAIYQILVSVFNFAPDMYAFGNKYVSIFFNEYCAPLLFPPIFCYYIVQKENIYHLYKAIYTFCLISLVLVGLGKHTNFAFTPVFLAPLFPYVSNKMRAIIICSFCFGIYYAKINARMMLIVVAFAIASLFIAYLFKSKSLRLAFGCLVLIVPLYFFVPILNAEKGEPTPIQQAIELFMSREEDSEEDTTDTRSYMYIEMAMDLTNTNSWLLGKGAYSHYISEFEHNNNFKGNGPDYGRLSTEVPFLNYILRGGLVYVFFYLLLFIVAVIKGLWLGKNKFVIIISIIAAGWYFNSFIGDTEGCRFYHLVFFSLVGCCFSKSILKSSDVEIQAMFDNQYRKLQLLKNILFLRILSMRINPNKKG